MVGQRQRSCPLEAPLRSPELGDPRDCRRLPATRPGGPSSASRSSGGADAKGHLERLGNDDEVGSSAWKHPGDQPINLMDKRYPDTSTTLPTFDAKAVLL